MNPCAYSSMCKSQHDELELAKIALQEAVEFTVYYSKHKQGSRLDMANMRRAWVAKYVKNGVIDLGGKDEQGQKV